MKKFLTLLLVMMLIMTAFTACGSKDDAEGGASDVNTEVNADAEEGGEDGAEEDADAETDGGEDGAEEDADKEEESVKEDEKKEEEKPAEDQKPAEDKKEDEKPAESKPAAGKTEAKAPTGTPAEIIDMIYAKHPVEAFPIGTIEIDINDADALKMFTGLSSASKIEAAAASEAMMGSQAYSLVVVKAKSTKDAADVMEEMVNGIDQRKWICVEADDLSAASCGNVVVLMMVGSDHADVATSAGIIDAFSAVCGGLDARA